MSDNPPQAGPGAGEPDDTDILAAEYVMGLLDAEQMLAVQREAQGDDRLAAAIAAWEQRLAPLADTVKPVTPPTTLWLRIEGEAALLPQGDAPQAAGPTTTTFLATAPDEPPSNVVPLQPRRSFAARVWNSPGLWRAATALSLALAAVFAAVAFLPRGGTELPVAVASIGPVGAPPPAFLAEARPSGAVTVSAVSPGAVPAGRDLELWLVLPGAQRPESLGVLPAAGKTMQLDVGLPAGSQLLISLEPHGGSPTGQPTGPVLYGGKLTQRS